MKKVLTTLIAILVSMNFAFALKHYDPCLQYIPYVKKYSRTIFGLDYPWWYNIGQLIAETDCRWETSRDGWASVGPAQITPAFESRYLHKLGLKRWWMNMNDYFYGYLMLMHRYLFMTNHLCYTGPTIQKRMWAWFQVYNTGPGGVVNAAISRAGVCDWRKARRHCHGINVCVWRTPYGCRQWRNACSINFDYGLNIFRYGNRYKPTCNYKTTWLYW